MQQNLDVEISNLESEKIKLVTVLEHPTMNIHGIDPLSATIIPSEYGNACRFSSQASILSFAGLEPGFFRSGISTHAGQMAERGSSILRYTLMNC